MINIKKSLAEIYLEYINDFLTVERYACYHGIPFTTAKNLIEAGRIEHEENVRIFEENEQYKKGRQDAI